MTVRLTILLAVAFLTIGLAIYWITEKNGEVGFSELAACKKQCAVENKAGQLVPFSTTQISKRGDFIGPLKCQCV
jgi:hypothetical protein